MQQHPHVDEFADRLRVKVDLIVPEFAAGDHYDLWALSLIEKSTWSADIKHPEFESIPGQEQLFFQAFLQTSRLLCELGRLPVFDIPRVVALIQDKQNTKKYSLEIEYFLVPFVPQDAYQIPIKVSLELCRWMAQHSPTLENKTKVFNTITEKVIKPLNRIVPAGKSTIPVLKAVHSMGIPYMHLGLGTYQVGWGSKARRLDRSTSELDSVIGSKLAQNKVVAANILRAAGLPSPVHGVVETEIEALAAAAKIGYPLVVKPADLDRGEGVTVDVSDELGLKAAFAHSQKLSRSKQIIVERQVSGVCHRLYIANGRLLYAVKRNPMSVIGDGKRSIKQLVNDAVNEQSCKPPWHRSDIKPIDELAIQTFEKLGLTSDSVPGEGAVVPLRRIESNEWGGVDEEVTSVVHAENLDIALQAAQLFGLHIAGIDIISPDITKPWHATGAIINEVNYAPLFGGAEISRSYIPEFLTEFVDGNGKIPIAVFETEAAALEYKNQQQNQGRRCYFTSADRTLDESGKEIVMNFKDIHQRVRALILRPSVDAISIVQ
ncbi:hypothetical protein [Zwartia sp.]|uniref:ATP-binding protein n=1 Tax=Zwartia sp. TaxID=2978004 RepID=UPI00271E714A|nr:hypothetical protein [Zwartia sp.]MDO9026226.1 hypothetical protein [Zwartia sp.]